MAAAFVDILPLSLRSLVTPEPWRFPTPKAPAPKLDYTSFRKKPLEWLEFVDEPDNILSTDITSTQFVGEPGKCSNNLSRPGSPFWHPSFVFKESVPAVRVELLKNGKKIWDVIFAGPPGPARVVPNDAPPAGGNMPLFPEFCPPLNRTDTYVLHVEHVPTGGETAMVKFAEDVGLRAKNPMVGLHLMMRPSSDWGFSPRPPFMAPQEFDHYSNTRGAALSETIDKQHLDFESGRPAMSAVELRKMKSAERRTRENLLSNPNVQALADARLKELGIPSQPLVAASSAEGLVGLVSLGASFHESFDRCNNMSYGCASASVPSAVPISTSRPRYDQLRLYRRIRVRRATPWNSIRLRCGFL